MIAHQKGTLSSEKKARKNDVLSLGKEKLEELVFVDYFDSFEFKDRRNEIFNKNYLERHSVSFIIKDGKNPYEAAYEKAIKRPVRTEVYYVDPVTGEELAERSEGAERKTREVIDPAILDGWENDIV